MSKFTTAKLTSIFLTGTSVLVSSAAFAATPVILPQIIVTPARTPLPANQIASSVTVISQEEIEQQNRPSVTELLREVSGLSIVNNGGTGQITRVFMRGTNSNHVLVLMDGVALNDPSDPADAFDFSNLTTDNIERIEVLRGPQSTLYGSQAIGGVIQIFTKQGRGKPRHTAFAEYGRYNTRRDGVGSSGEIGRTSYSFTASELHTDGISSFNKKYGGHEKDGNNTYTFATNVASKLTDTFTAKINARYNRTQTAFDSPGSIPNFGLRPDDDSAPDNDTRQFNGRVGGEWSLLGGRWTQELGFSMLNINRGTHTEFFDAFFAPHFGHTQFQGHHDTIEWVHHIKASAEHMITAGIETSTEYFKSANSTASVPEVNVDNRAFFVDDQYTVTDNLFVNFGVRLDDHQAFGRQLTWKVAPGYNIKSTGTRLKATYGTGFKAPSLSQLFDPVSGNAALGPERSKGWDAGFEQTLWGDKVTFGSTFFRNDITGLIGFGPAPLFETLNVGKARTEGVENSIALCPTNAWSINASHVYTLSEDRSHNIELKRRPKHQANLSTTYQYNANADAGAYVRYVGLSRDFLYNSPVGEVIEVKSFATVGLNANYKLNQNMTLYGRLDNLLDKRYEELSGYGQPGRGLYGGIKATY